MISPELRSAWTRAVENFSTSGRATDELRRALDAGEPTGGSGIPVNRVDSGAPSDLLGELRARARDAASGDFEARLVVVVALGRIAFVSPEATLPVMDALAEGWLLGKRGAASRDHGPIEAPPEPDAATATRTEALLTEPGRVPPVVLDLLFDLISGPFDPAMLTARIAAFGLGYDDNLKERCARAVMLHAEQDVVARSPEPPRLRLEDLQGRPAGSLGEAFYRLIIDNGFDLEVLDGTKIQGFHPVIDGVSRRILQLHEIWHLVAGYSTSPLHEVAISGFQLAQFGHNYSADFLATSALLLATVSPDGLDAFLQVTFEGWTHGRETRPLMSIDWHALLGEGLPEIRGRFGITTFESAVPEIPMPSAAA